MEKTREGRTRRKGGKLEAAGPKRKRVRRRKAEREEEAAGGGGKGGGGGGEGGGRGGEGGEGGGGVGRGGLYYLLEGLGKFQRRVSVLVAVVLLRCCSVQASILFERSNPLIPPF